MKKLLRRNGRLQLIKKENANLMINLKDYARPRLKNFFKKKNFFIFRKITRRK
jgi:hypothetical protein